MNRKLLKTYLEHSSLLLTAHGIEMEFEEGIIDEDTLLFNLRKYFAARPSLTRFVLESIAASYELPPQDFEAIEDYILQAVPIKPIRITIDLIEMTDESRTMLESLNSHLFTTAIF